MIYPAKKSPTTYGARGLELRGLDWLGARLLGAQLSVLGLDFSCRRLSPPYTAGGVRGYGLVSVCSPTPCNGNEISPTQ
jgi:hypothetical protein